MIRIFQHGDHIAIAKIFTGAVHEIASEVYTPEQCLAWSSKEVNYGHWRTRCELKRPFVAEKNGQIAGFLELDPDGRIDCAYINPKYKRKGIMTALVKHAVDVCFSFGLGRVQVDASICARPLFEKAGFKVIRENLVRLGNEELVNFRMELLREIEAPSTATDGNETEDPRRASSSASD